MTRNRRDFLLSATVLASPILWSPLMAAGQNATPSTAPAASRPATAPRQLNILFLGGTGFLGPHVVRTALDRGHTVTLFNRGSRAELFPELELIKGNRIVDEAPGLDELRRQVEEGRRWDVVIDTASVHRWVETAAEVLEPAADQYIYVSSLSAYDRTDTAQQKEGDAVATMPDEIADTIDRLPYDMQYYGAVKARSEQAAERRFPGRATVVRPGLIVGPRDTTHRFTYWPQRVRAGGAVLAPGNPDDPVMFIDVRDLAEFMVKLAEEKQYGIFNANGPVSGDMTIGKLLEACRTATKSDATFTWVDAEFLAQRDIGGWVAMPVWLPPVGEYRGFHQTNLEKSRAAGLRTRPLEQTIPDTLEWFDRWLLEVKERRGYEYQPGENAPGVTREREREVLAEWAEHVSEQEG